MTAPIRRRATARISCSQVGMTLLEIMIVLAIIALVMGLLVGPRVLRMFGQSERELAAMEVKGLACGAYTEWRREHRRICPSSLTELLPYTNKSTLKDPWGADYVMLCGTDKPEPAAVCIGVLSLGPDGERGTDDDVVSWEDEQR